MVLAFDVGQRPLVDDVVQTEVLLSLSIHHEQSVFPHEDLTLLEHPMNWVNLPYVKIGEFQVPGQDNLTCLVQSQSQSGDSAKHRRPTGARWSAWVGVRLQPRDAWPPDTCLVPGAFEPVYNT